jgi:hypothetical protein
MTYNFHILCKFPKSFISAYDMKVARQHQASKVLAYFRPILHQFAHGSIQTICNTRNQYHTYQTAPNIPNQSTNNISKLFIKHQLS